MHVTRWRRDHRLFNHGCSDVVWRTCDVVLILLQPTWSVITTDYRPLNITRCLPVSTHLKENALAISARNQSPYYCWRLINSLKPICFLITLGFFIYNNVFPSLQFIWFIVFRHNSNTSLSVFNFLLNFLIYYLTSFIKIHLV